MTSINPDFGFDSNTANGPISRKVTKIASFNYVYRISNPAPSGTTNVKLVPYLITAGVQQFADISGPSDCANSPEGTHCITDSTFGKYCIARAANECVAGSSRGQVFYTSKNSYDPGVCISNNSFLYAPCLYPMRPNAGWFEQIPSNTHRSRRKRGSKADHGLVLTAESLQLHELDRVAGCQVGLLRSESG